MPEFFVNRPDFLMTRFMQKLFDGLRLLDDIRIIVHVVPNFGGPLDNSHVGTIDHSFENGIGIAKAVNTADFNGRIDLFKRFLNGNSRLAVSRYLGNINQ